MRKKTSVFCNQLSGKDGFSIQMVLAITGIVLVLTTTMATVLISELRSFNRYSKTEDAYSVAKEGVLIGLAYLNKGGTIPVGGLQGEVKGGSDETAKGVYSVKFNSQTKILSSIGTVRTIYKTKQEDKTLSKNITIKLIDDPQTYRFEESFSSPVRKDSSTTALWQNGAASLPSDIYKGWVKMNLSVKPTPGRSRHAIAYDSDQNKAVLFGGENYSGTNSTQFRDTWTFDGNNWTNESVAGPSYRINHSMTYDSYRRKILLFGGVSTSGSRPLGGAWWYTNDIWEYDVASKTWTNKTPSTGPSPAARESATLVYDKQNNKTILFGGYSSAYIDDMWKWDGSAWQSIPKDYDWPPKYAHSAIFNTDRNIVQMIGPKYRVSGMDLIWEGDVLSEWDGSAWPSIQGWTGSPGLSGTGSTPFLFSYDKKRSVAVLFRGGTWELNGKTQSVSWQNVGSTEGDTPAPVDWKASMVYHDSIEKSILVNAEGDASKPNETFSWPNDFVKYRTPRSIVSTSISGPIKNIRKATFYVYPASNSSGDLENLKINTFNATFDGASSIDVSTGKGPYKSEVDFGGIPADNLYYSFVLKTNDQKKTPRIDHVIIKYTAGPRYKIDYSTWRTD